MTKGQLQQINTLSKRRSLLAKRFLDAEAEAYSDTVPPPIPPYKSIQVLIEANRPWSDTSLYAFMRELLP